MRRRLALLVAAAMALVLVSLIVPLGLLVRRAAADRAVSQAVVEVQSLSVLVATSDPTALRLSIERVNATAAHPVTVFLPDGTTVGAAAARTPAVELSARGESFSVAGPAGREIVVSVAGLSGGTAVIRSFVPAAELTRGVGRAYLLLGLIGAVLLALGVAVADRLAFSVVRPIGELARVSDRLAGGELDARAAGSGTPEVRALAVALNHLAGRIRDLLRQERESAADISHRLRTPLTALRLDAESLADPVESARIVEHVTTLDRALTGVIEHTRAPTAAPARADLARIVTERCAFWAVLAEDQGRVMAVEVLSSGVPVGVTPAVLAACVDALVGNVFAHTPDTSAFSVVLDGPQVTVADSGPGFPTGDVVRRGVSKGGSSGLGLDIVRQVAVSVTVGRSPTGGASVCAVFPPALTEP